MVRGLGLVVVGLFLVAQVVIASFDLTVLGRVLDYLLTTVLLGLLVIFQPELRRGLMVLGRYRILRYFGHDPQHPVADKLADAAEAMSRECVGALIAIEREMALATYVETGEPIDAEVSADAAAGDLQQAQPAARRGRDPVRRPASPRPPASCRWASRRKAPSVHMGMRHRAALALSEETDAVLLVVSEETGRISLGGRRPAGAGAAREPVAPPGGAAQRRDDGRAAPTAKPHRRAA